MAPENAGYFGGGQPTGKTIVDKLDYSGETTARVPGANLTSARSYLGATETQQQVILLVVFLVLIQLWIRLLIQQIQPHKFPVQT